MIAWEPLHRREVDGLPDHVYVAWHGGGAWTLRIGRRHIADMTGARQTLCGLTWKRSTEVIPDSNWTTGDCARCGARARKRLLAPPR